MPHRRPLVTHPRRPLDAAPVRSPSTGTRRRRNRRRRAPTRVGSAQRSRIALLALLAVLGAALVRVFTVQLVDPSGYAAKADQQSTRTITLAAQRGSITDRTGRPLAFDVDGRAVAARPALIPDPTQRDAVAELVAADTGADIEAVRAALNSDGRYVYLARDVLPAQADALVDKIRTVIGPDEPDAVVTERQDIRVYPDPALAAIIGSTDRDGNGLSGVEAKLERTLAGRDGRRVVDVDGRGSIIPTSARDEEPAVDGADLTLTIDSDLQSVVQQQLTGYVDAAQAGLGCVVVMQVADAQIAAMACAESGRTPKETGNRAVTDAFEPGSVNKVVTFAGALENGLVTPDSVLTVDGAIDIGDITVNDAWPHGPVPMTATGVLAKSSNVGTLMVAQQLGEDTFLDLSTRFGLGDRTGVELPAETAGRLPSRAQWSASTFGNLPIGQGVSMTLVQLAGLYQAIGNGGVRLPPTIVRNPAGSTDAGTRVVGEPTARTLLGMLQGTVQDGPAAQRGTAPQAAIAGYQVAAKTGTAQKVDPDTGQYSQTAITSTFAGIVPADDPQYVIAIMLDDPKAGSPAGTTSCAPLFHQIATSVIRAAAIPPSAQMPPPTLLTADQPTE